MKTTDNSLMQAVEIQTLSPQKPAARLLGEFSQYILLATIDFLASDLFELGCFLLPASHWDEDTEIDIFFQDCY